MKTIKLIITGLLIMIAVTISGDLFQDYLRHFEYKFDHTSFSLPFKINGEEMTNDLLNTAQKNDVRFFTVQRKSNGIYEDEICIYCSDLSVMSVIDDECKISVRSYDSLFFGKTIITVKSFEEATNELLTGSYYLLGDSENELNFKMSLIDKYGGGLITDGYDPRDDSLIVIMLWVAVLVIYILLSLFEFFLTQKKIALLISMGANISKLIIKNVIVDVAALLSIYLLFRIAAARFTNPNFYQIYHYIFVLLIVAVDIVSYMRYRKINVQHVLKGNRSQNTLLNCCYVGKCITTALTVALIASNLITISDALTWRSQEDFWKKYYSYNQLSARYICENDNCFSDTQKNSDLNYKAYCYFFNKANVSLMSYVADEDFFGQPVIAYNKNLTDYLQNSLKSIDFWNLTENKVYALLPIKCYKNGFTSLQKDELDHMSNYLIDWDGSYTEGSEIIYYENDVRLLALESNPDFIPKYYKNPIILFVNIDEEKNPRINTGDDNIGSNVDFTIYDTSPDDFRAFLQADCPSGYSIQVFFSNVKDQFLYKLSVKEKSLYISVFLLVLITLLNSIITYVTVQMNYTINAVELSIKKVLGYSMFELHKATIIGSFICSFFSTIIATVINLALGSNVNPFWVPILGMFFLLTDLILITLIIKKMENKQIVKALKGGAL